MKHRLLPMIMSFILSAGTVISSGAAVSAKAQGWRELYAGLLREKMQSGLEYPDAADAFSLYDLNSDGIPELILSQGDYHGAQCMIYTVSNGELKKVDNLGSYGLIAYSYDGYVVGGYMGMGISTVAYYRMKNGGLESVVSFEDNSGTSDEDMEIEFLIDGKKVSSEEYDKRRSEMYEAGSVTIGRTFAVNEDSIRYAVTGVKNYKKAYAGVLRGYLSSPYFDKNYKYTLMDITGDRTPELIINAGGALDIYTFVRGRAQLVMTDYLYMPSQDDLSIGYSYDRKMLIVSSGDADNGKASKSFYSTRSGSIKCRDEAVCLGDGQYKVNEEDASAAEYRKVLEKYPCRHISYGTVYDISEKNISALG